MFPLGTNQIFRRLGSHGTKKGLGKNSKLLLCLLIAIAAVTGFGLYSYLNTLRVPVYLFNGDYEKETRIGDINFLRVEMDVDTYNAITNSGTKYASADDIAYFKSRDDVLVMDVVSYTPFTMNQAVTTGGTALESRLGENMVSVELPVETVPGLSDGVRVGSRINLLSSLARGEVRETDLVFENLLVLGVAEDGNGQIRSVYVELEPSEAVSLVHCLTYETVTANILKPGSYIRVPEEERIFKKDYTPVKENTVTDYWSAGAGTEAAAAQNE